jgi:hypothetical protein
LQAAEGKPIALAGVVAGGGPRDDGIGKLGVFLDHDPADFGIAAVAATSSMRTGGQASADNGDLDWRDSLPEGDLRAIAALRGLLAHRRKPVDRHYMYADLEGLLYRSRDVFQSALDEYDAACVAHDAEMETIRPALIAQFGSLPMLETYRQSAIRHEKARNLGGSNPLGRARS